MNESCYGRQNTIRMMKNIIRMFQISYLVPEGQISQLSSTYSSSHWMDYFYSSSLDSNFLTSSLNRSEVLMFCLEKPQIDVNSWYSSSLNSLEGFSALMFCTSGRMFSMFTPFTSSSAYPRSLQSFSCANSTF